MVKYPQRSFSKRWGKVIILLGALAVLFDAVRFLILEQSYQPIITDAFETVVAAFGAVACSFAAKRSSTVTRGLWVLTALYLGILALADLHDFLVDIHLGPAILLSALELVGWFTYVPLALLAFYPASLESKSRWQWLPVLDFAQVAVAVAAAYFTLVYVPHADLGQDWETVTIAQVTLFRLVVVGLLLRALVEPCTGMRRFYQSIAAAHATILAARLIFNAYAPVVGIVYKPAALLALGILAVYWNDRSDDEVESGRRPIALRLALSLFAATTLILVVLLAVRISPEYHWARYSILGFSILLFVGRTYMAERTRFWTEHQLRESEREYRTMFEQAIEGIYRLTPDGKLTAANPALARILGYPSVEDLVSAAIDSRQEMWRDPQDRRAFLEALEQNGVVQGFECDIVRKDGAIIRASLASCTVRDPKGATLYHQGFLEDITKRTELERELRLAQKMEALGQLAGGVAHDFNNILCAMMVNIDVAGPYVNLDPRLRAVFDDLRDDADRASNLTRQLLLFSRRSVMDAKVLDLNEVITNLLKMLGRLIGENTTVQFHPRDRSAIVKADTNLIEQVLVNLAVNARDAMPQGGTITMATEIVNVGVERRATRSQMGLGTFVCLSVSDTGCGIPEDVRTRIFEPFFTTKEPGKGTGLGLATVDGIVAQHDGWVEVESEVGRGSTFKVFLPTAQETVRGNA